MLHCLLEVSCCLLLQVLQDIVGRGADPANIRVVVIVAAPPALKLMADAYPGKRPEIFGSAGALLHASGHFVCTKCAYHVITASTPELLSQ
jgi:hypothetical protein